MAGCLGSGKGGNVSPDTLRRWTENLSNVLHDPVARQKFRDYLEFSKLKEELRLLEFWEKCNIFLIQPERSTKMKQDAQLITEFADSKINFDAAEMQALYTAVKSGDEQTIKTAVSQAKQRATEMLEVIYQEFCKYLRKQQGML